jgi:hypothetical protein
LTVVGWRGSSVAFTSIVAAKTIEGRRYTNSR